ncbi:16S rRNA (guanine(966)-N(2))-methyltransferase RsmD [Pelagivirga sediminicola]|uniref:16S rRNA (Guanine(966)-N(2))-methyltransferase RsmD n=1 Tax=Pelagivirga sediminicola TaxID=2170575 RepID=A0A2T7G715_9RHOB|nr:16S rRNA (guanine(966)-N(2))-methyltransferase RsmD [Pelagivirga sediminicola]PVA10166.1 16S rRNA (guanine(966)-N(2))-methyltransferase RsmD [Pelagivirga sediminicola]
MRIIAGEARGRRLASVGKGDAAAQLRPTSDRVRESLFSVLTGLGVIEDAEVLDVFAGTGALGLEALSRGAAAAQFVENGRAALALLDENIRLTGLADRAKVMRRDVRRLGAAQGAPATLVFLDPPYGRELGEAALGALIAGGWLAPGALIVWEESQAITPPPNCTLRDQRRYGDTRITLLEWQG